MLALHVAATIVQRLAACIYGAIAASGLLLLSVLGQWEYCTVGIIKPFQQLGASVCWHVVAAYWYLYVQPRNLRLSVQTFRDCVT